MARVRASRGEVAPAVVIYDFDVGEISARLLVADLLQRRVNVVLLSGGEPSRNEALVKRASKHVVLVTKDVFQNGKGNSQELLEALSAEQREALVFTHETEAAFGAPTRGRGKDVDLREMARRCSAALQQVFDPAKSVPFNRERHLRVHAVDQVMVRCRWTVRELFYHPRMLLHRRVRSSWKRFTVKRYGYNALLTKSKEHVERMEKWVQSKAEENVMIVRCDNEAKATALLKDAYNLSRIHDCVVTQYYFDAQSFSTLSTRMWILSLMAQLCKANANELYDKLRQEMQMMDLRSNFDYLSFGEQALVMLVDFVRRKNVAYSIKGRIVVNIVSGVEHLAPREAECFIHIVRCYWSRFLPKWFRVVVSVQSEHYAKIIDSPNVTPVKLEIPPEGLDAAELRHVVKQFVESVEYCGLDSQALRKKVERCRDFQTFAKIFRWMILDLVGLEEYSRVFSVLLAAREPLSSRYFYQSCPKSFSKVLPLLSVILRIDYEELVQDNDHGLLSFKSVRLRNSFLHIDPELESMGHAHLAEWAMSTSDINLNGEDVAENTCAVADVLQESGLCNLIFHLCHTARYHEVHVKVCNIRWLLRAISSMPVAQLLADMEPFGELDLRKHQPSTEVFLMFQRVRRILRITKDFLLLQPLELIAQLEAKLHGGNDLGNQLLAESKACQFLVPRLSPLKPLFDDEEASRNLLYKRVAGTAVKDIAAVPGGRHFYVSCEHTLDVLQYDALNQTEAFVVRTLPVGGEKPVASMVTTKQYDRLITSSSRDEFVVWDINGDVMFMSTLLNGQVEKLELSCNDVNLFVLCSGGRRIYCFKTDSPDEPTAEVHLYDTSGKVAKVVCCDALDDGLVYLGYSDGSVGYVSENSVRLLADPLGRSIFSMAAVAAAEVVHLVAGLDSGDCVVINTSSSEIVSRVQAHTGPVHAIVTKDRQYITAAADGLVKLWDEQFEVSTVVGKHDGAVTCVGILPGSKVVSGGIDGYLNVWRLPNLDESAEDEGKKDVQTKQHSTTVTCVSMSPDGQLVGTTSFDRQVIVRSLQSGVVAFHKKESAKKFVYGTSDGKVVVHEVEEKGQELVLMELGRYSHLYGVWTLSFSKDSSMIASGGADSKLQVWNWGSDTPLEQLLEADGHSAAVCSVAFSPSMRVLASASHKASKTLCMWELEYDSKDPTSASFTCAKVFSEASFQGYVATLLAFSPNTELLVAACQEPDVRKRKDNTEMLSLVIIQAQAPYRPVRIMTTHVCLSTYFLSFDVTSGYVAVAGYDTKTVYFWNISTGYMVIGEDEEGLSVAESANACVNCALQGIHAGTFCYNHVAEPNSPYGIGFSTYKSAVVAGPTPKRHLAMVTADKSRVVVQERFNVSVLKKVPPRGEDRGAATCQDDD